MHNPESCDRKYAVKCLSCGEMIPDVAEASSVVQTVSDRERVRTAIYAMLVELGIDPVDADHSAGKYAIEVFEKSLKEAP